MPERVGVPCCSQFALSREKIHERPLEDYIWVRQWLLDSPLDASITGRIFEYSWHSKFKFKSTFLSLASESPWDWTWNLRNLQEGFLLEVYSC